MSPSPQRRFHNAGCQILWRRRWPWRKTHILTRSGEYLGQGEARGLGDGPAQLVPDGLGDIPVVQIKYFSLTGDPYLATREWVDLISGNGSDMARLNLVGSWWVSKDTAGKREAWELALATSKEERSDCYVDWPAALLEQIRIQQAWGSIFWGPF